MFCMKSSSRLARTVRGMLPDGFDGDAVELTVVGRCAECATPWRPGPALSQLRVASRHSSQRRRRESPRAPSASSRQSLADD
jgi:hypothetical protein